MESEITRNLVFDGKNYSDWSFRMRMFLDEKGVLDLVTKGLSECLEECAPSDTDSLNVRKRKEEAAAEWRTKDARAKGLITRCVADSALGVLMDLDERTVTARGMWEALRSRFQAVTMGTRMLLSHQFKTMSYSPPEQKFLDFCLKFDGMLRDLRRLGDPIDDTSAIVDFLWKMPPSYETITTNIRNNPQNFSSMSSVRLAIEEFELARYRGSRGSTSTSKGSKSGTMSSVAFGARSSPYQRRGGHHQAPSDRLCNNCGGRNHIKAECWCPGGGAFRGNSSSFRGRGQSGRGGHPRGQQGGRSGRGRGRGGVGSGGWHSRGASHSSSERAALAADDDNNVQDEVVYFCVTHEREVERNNCSKIPRTNGAEIDETVALFAKPIINSESVMFILDSGASNHMVNNGELVRNSITLDRPVRIKIAKSTVSMFATKRGDFYGTTNVFGKRVCLTLRGVLVVKDLEMNLLSISKLEKEGLEVSFKSGLGRIIDGDTIMGVGVGGQGVYKLIAEVSCNPVGLAMVAVTEDLWHKRLGHIGAQNLKRLTKMVDGLENLKVVGNEFCDICLEGKQTRLPFNGTREPTTRPLERVHSDLCGPIKPVAHDGSKYILTFIDDFTHFTVVFGLKRKKEVHQYILAYEARVTSKFSLKISNFRCDNGGEYLSDRTKEFFTEKGIKFELTVPGTPQQNGVSERMNRTILNKARCMLFWSNLRRDFWIEAVLTAVYLLNRSPTRALIGEKVPAELWFNSKPDLSKLRVFGCVGFVCTLKEHLDGKFDKRSRRCIMLGYVENGYRVWSVSDKRIITARDVVFDESRNKFNDLEDFEDYIFDLTPVEKTDDSETEEAEEDAFDFSSSAEEDLPAEGPREELLEQEVRRSGRVRMRPHYLNDYVAMVVLANFVNEFNGDTLNQSLEQGKVQFDDSTYELALSALNYSNCVPLDFSDLEGREDKHLWVAAISEELQSLEENGTWELVSLPKGKKPIKSKWVFTVKEDGDGNVVRYKARLVVKGCSQEKGINYEETYAPVARLATVRALLCLIHQQNLHVSQLDVKNAFLHGVLKEEIYMWPPEGLLLKDYEKVCKLKRTLYGLKQAPMEWNKRFDEFVKSLGFKQCEADRCVYILIKCSFRVYLLLYVDDFLIASDSNIELIKVKEKLMTEFKMRDLGDVKHFLGIKVTKIDGGLFLSQENYLRRVISKFSTNPLHSSSTPLDIRPCRSLDKECIIGKHPYRELIGSLMYACMATRPDICVAVNFFSQFQCNATEDQWKGLKRVLRYLYGTLKWGLWYRGNSNTPIRVYADADFANEPGRKSISGFVIKLFGDTVIWGTRKQTSVAQSSAEAEYVSLATAVSEVLWFKQLLRELMVHNLEMPIPVHEDNQSCISYLSNWESKRMKHIDVKYNFVKDLHKEKIISVNYIPSTEQIADIMTKGLPLESFSRHRESLGMSVCEL